MKKGISLLIGFFFIVTNFSANNNINVLLYVNSNYSYKNVVNFVETGIEFFVFTDGVFDFNCSDSSFKKNTTIFIDRDYNGRIKSVGNTIINYDNFGNVTRIGNVSMRYKRGILTNVGNLSINYDRWGNTVFYGNVYDNFYVHNGITINLHVGDICNYNDTYFYHRDFRTNYSLITEDNNYFYYRANSNAKIKNRSNILRQKNSCNTYSYKK